MRHAARQWAVMILYGMDLARTGADRAVPDFFFAFEGNDPIDPPPSWDRHPAFRVRIEAAKEAEVKGFAEALVRGVEAHRDRLDTAVQAVSANWKLHRMSAVDRNVLRLAAYELIHRSTEVPRKVVINEAVELAKTFGAAESGAFVNGILDKIGPPL